MGIILTGIKVFSDVAFKCFKILGRQSSCTTIGIGLFVDIQDIQAGTQIQIQASTADSPLQAKALALLLPAKITILTFFLPKSQFNPLKKN